MACDSQAAAQKSKHEPSMTANFVWYLWRFCCMRQFLLFIHVLQCMALTHVVPQVMIYITPVQPLLHPPTSLPTPIAPRHTHTSHSHTQRQTDRHTRAWEQCTAGQAPAAPPA